MSGLRNRLKDKTLAELNQEVQLEPDTEVFRTCVMIRGAMEITKATLWLTAAIDRASESSNRIATRVWWLNVFLVLVSAVGVEATVVLAIIAYQQWTGSPA